MIRSGDGEDPSRNTILEVSMSVKGTVLQIGSKNLNWYRRRPDTSTEITSPFLPVGSRVFTVSEPNKYEVGDQVVIRHFSRSEKHTSELQSRGQLVCRLLLEKKKNEIRY